MKAIFLRVIEADDKAAALLESIQAPESGNGKTRFEVDPRTFSQVPKSPFAYWVSERVRAAFTRLPRFESEGRTAKQGLATADDFRFVRLWTEVAADRVGRAWFPFAKGGKFSPFYADVYLVVNWSDGGREITNFFSPGGRLASRPQNVDFFFRPGLTWPLRTNGLSFRAMPAGCIFGHKGPAAFVESDAPAALLALCAVVNSKAFGALVSLQLARTELAQSYEVGLIQNTPIPDLPPSEKDALAALAHRAWLLKRALDTRTETSHAFVLPALLQVDGATLMERAEAWGARVRDAQAELAHIQEEIDERCFALYGIDGEDRRQIERGFGAQDEADNRSNQDEDENEEDEPEEVDAAPMVASLLSWSVGVAFGRFDVALATGVCGMPVEPEPFDPLPTCSAGMLTGADGLPEPEPPPEYLIAFPPDGILIDDPGFNGSQPHRDDIVRRVREVLDLLWKDKAHKIEQEVCEVLGVKDLRDYFRRPAGFFQDHLKRCSKSRRKAPIYWPLSTATGSYTIWLYYHRLTDQTFYAAVNKYVEPKIAEVEHAIGRIEKDLEAASGRDATQLRDRLNEGRALAGELHDLRQELLRIAALPYKPNLNDGVIINAAPFHKLFGLRAWAKDTETVWKKLEKGDCDWAHLAYTLWPDRVKETCRKDRSIAIAHGLESLCEVSAPRVRKSQPNPKQRRSS